MMESDHAAIHLTVLLMKGGVPSPNKAALLNNLVYYTPRIRNIKSLQHLVRCIFESPLWAHSDLFELYELSQAIFQWKLEISEPTICLREFYDAWDMCFTHCRAWTREKLALIGGVLGTESRFVYLQRNHFSDDSGKVIKLYVHWKNEFFLPTWCSYLSRPQSLSQLDELIAIYSTISNDQDVKNIHIPWDTVTRSLIRLSTNYIAASSPADRCYSSTVHLQEFVKTLKISITKSNINSVSEMLSQLCRECFNLSLREFGCPKDNYTGEYYRNILFTVIIELKAILDATRLIPENWYPQIIMCLFCINFIAEDIGINSFISYQHVYDVITTGITMYHTQSIYLNVLDTMIGNIWDEIPIHNNKPNDAKRMFMLNYLERTLPDFRGLTPQFIKNVIKPMRLSYIDSSDTELRDSMHLVILSIFQNSVSGDDLLVWQARHYDQYVALSTNHFLLNKLSERQLLIIYQTMSSALPLLQAVDKHLSRNTLHRTYLKILNCSQIDQKRVLLLCLIYQLPYVNKEFLIDWLNTCKELLTNISFSEVQTKEILGILWEVISRIKSDLTLKWWYSDIVPIKSHF